MIIVFFESSVACEKVAIFNSEELYNSCLPLLEKLANQQGWEKITEYCIERDIDELE